MITQILEAVLNGGKISVSLATPKGEGDEGELPYKDSYDTMSMDENAAIYRFDPRPQADA